MLNAIIVGGGIAGLTAAIALRRAGHRVHIYERSSFNDEVGAALHVPANAARVLLSWGMDPVRSRLVRARQHFLANGQTLHKMAEAGLLEVEERYGAPWLLAHRVDLHEELKRLATGDGVGVPAVVHLRSEVVSYVSANSSALATAPGTNRVWPWLIMAPRTLMRHL